MLTSLQRYYARALLTCLHRSIAVPEWAKLRRGEPVSLERALCAFDLFIPESGYGDLDEVSYPTPSVLWVFSDDDSGSGYPARGCRSVHRIPF